mmetsp:Transcript_21019/g.48545  ORF Transcript_21019/g.48545 Transcript_21019/m.48545 type:complete len:199 (+) Transcript_21019:112-708(+)
MTSGGTNENNEQQLDNSPSFVIELFSLGEMPHTVFTLLNLVDLQIYDGTAFVAANHVSMEGGSPSHATDAERTVKLYERLAKFGYGRSPLAYHELSPQPKILTFTDANNATATTAMIEKYTMGFTSMTGSGLILYMNDIVVEDDFNNDDHRGPCFAKVVQGFSTLERILKVPKAADGYRLARNVEITSARLVRQSQLK